MNQKLLLKNIDLKIIKQQLLAFSELFEICNIYDSNGTKAACQYGRFEIVAGFGSIHSLEGNFNEITSQINTSNEWIFGYFSYDSFSKFNTSQKLLIEDASFYKPKIICFIEHGSNTLTIENNGLSVSAFNEYCNILKDIKPYDNNEMSSKIDFEPCTLKPDYIENINKIKYDILNGNYYEINYCQKFIHHGPLNNPIASFNEINKKSPTPFAAFVKNKHYNILCTSPERFIFKKGNALISQPIKGTNERLDGWKNDSQLESLRNNKKEIAENVMIVDLVRNDMAKISETGSVKVEELCGVYPFALVNQMISTVTSTLRIKTSFADIFRSLFPMGSMTGAPKIEVMKNIALYENMPRGLYSGSIGYILPNGDFDFNVIIRTLVDDKLNQEVSYHVGGAITYDSVPEKEYEECLLKAKGLTEK